MPLFQLQRRLVLPLLLALLALAATGSSALAVDWKASANYAFTGNEGNTYQGILEGLTIPGGPFAGTFTAEASADALDGSNVLSFGGPHTLELSFHYWFTDTGGVGYYVVTAGTGRYANATGSGVTQYVDNGDGTGTVIFVGTLSH